SRLAGAADVIPQAAWRAAVSRDQRGVRVRRADEHALAEGDARGVEQGHQGCRSVPGFAYDQRPFAGPATQRYAERPEPRLGDSPDDVSLLVSHRRDPGHPPAARAEAAASVRGQPRGHGPVPRRALAAEVDAIDRVVMNARLYYLGMAARITQPALKLALLTCIDARVDPAALLGLRPGDAHVIRNAGGRATKDALHALAISQAALGTRE